MKRSRKSSSEAASDSKPLSDGDVARYLRELAALYRDKKTGNPPLAAALLRLANSVSAEDSANRPVAVAPTQGSEQPQLDVRGGLPPFEKMSPDEIQKFIVEPSRTKVELIQLAGARFGIPRGRLMKLRLNSVRDALRNALMHEASLALIGEEAGKYGERRQS